jgi:hypothetical protein
MLTRLVVAFALFSLIAVPAGSQETDLQRIADALDVSSTTKRSSSPRMARCIRSARAGVRRRHGRGSS